MDSGQKTVLTYCLVLAFACLEGVTHAILWSRKGAGAFKWNEHIIFLGTRFLLAPMILLPGSWQGLLAGVIAYPCFHNGFYYWFRNRIDGSYPQEFFDDSTSSTANINFSVRARVLMFVASLILLVFLLFYK
jgi:hypothetical protein